MRIRYSIRFLLFLIPILFAISCSSQSEGKKAEAKEALAVTTRVAVTGGTIEGVEQDGIFSYKGIPFAAPPVGDLRWKSPRPLIPWEGVKKADQFAPGPMQDTTLGVLYDPQQKISEDCLYLNVWTGARKTDEKRPVMVWIYGGGFGVGTTSAPVYDGTNLAKKGAVIVSVAYRVGPMGFLAHPELSAESGHGSGAYGIQDMIAGLRWAKENIAKFGGHPSNVTIFGESSGGTSVCMLVASPMAKGLFQRAISESGAKLVSPPRMDAMPEFVVDLKQAEEQGKAYLEKLGANTIAAARALSAEEIQKDTKGMGRFWPAGDGVTLPENMNEAFRTGSFNNTPILLGSNSNEGGRYVTQPVTSEAVEKMVRSQYASGAEGILKAYPHATDEEATQAAKDMIRDILFAWPTREWAILQTRNGKNKAYVYYFDHRDSGFPGGATHLAELPYVFGNLDAPIPIKSNKPAGPEDKRLSETMSSYWVNFAKTGNPNGEGLPKWPAFDQKESQVMYFDGDIGARKHPDLDKFRVFDSYFAKLRDGMKMK
jgi:para-nitrobenzyl esterase